MKNLKTINQYFNINEDNSIMTGTTSSNILEFFSKIFQSRDIAHVIHLATNSFAVHKALNEYYDDIVDLMDSLIESYQGIYGKIKLEIPSSINEDPIQFFTQLYSYVTKNKELFKADESLQNIIDEIADLISGTLYKLKELK